MQWKTLRKRALALAEAADDVHFLAGTKERAKERAKECAEQQDLAMARAFLAPRIDLNHGTADVSMGPTSLPTTLLRYEQPLGPLTLFSRPNNVSEPFASQTVIRQPDGTTVISSDPSLFTSEFCASQADRRTSCCKTTQAEACAARATSDGALSVENNDHSEPSLEGGCFGQLACGAFTQRRFPPDSAVGARITFAAAERAFRLATHIAIKPTDQFSGRCAVTEFFSNRIAYADPEQFTIDERTRRVIPTREDLYAVRFVNSAADQQGNTTRTPLAFQIDQMSGLLAPTAKIERVLLDDDFQNLSKWTIINSRNNYWQAGPLDGQTSAYITYTPGANDYLAGTPSAPSINHLFRDLYFPTDTDSGSMIVQLRVLGNGNIEEPTNYAQDFATIHMIDPMITPQPDLTVGFASRLEGLMITDAQSSGGYVIEHLVLRTNAYRGSLAGTTQRFVLSFEAGSGNGVQPMALAVSNIMIVGGVEIPQQPPVGVSPCSSTSCSTAISGPCAKAPTCPSPDAFSQNQTFFLT